MKLERAILQALILAIILLAATQSGTATKKHKSRKIGSKKYNNLILFTYGDGHQDSMQRLKQNCQAFGWPRKSLGCSPLAVTCTEQWLNKLDQIKTNEDSSYVVLFNHSSVLINHQRVPLLTLLKKQPSLLISEQDAEGNIMLVADLQIIRTLLKRHSHQAITSIFGDEKVIREFTAPNYNYSEVIFAAFNDTGFKINQPDDISGQPSIYDMQSKNQPIFVFDNSSSPDSLETLSNILMKPSRAKNYHEVDQYPGVHLVVIIETPALFLEEFFQKITELDYPPERLLSLSIVVAQQQQKLLHKVVTMMTAIKEDFKSKVSIVETITEALRSSQEDNAESFTFFIRSSAQLEVPSVLKELTAQKEKVLAPLLLTYSDSKVWTLISPYDLGWQNKGIDVHTPMQVLMTSNLEDSRANNLKMFTIHNFNVHWTNLTLAYLFGPTGEQYEQGSGVAILEENDPRLPELQAKLEKKRAESIEALPISGQILENIRRSRALRDISRVLHLTDCYLVKSEILKDYTFPLEDKTVVEDSIWFSNQLRSKKIPLKVLHRKAYGQVVNTYGLNEDLENPELGRFYENHDLWQQRYIDPQVIKTYGRGNEMYVGKPSESPLSLISETVCKDVFLVKLFKPLFAQHLLQEALRHDALFQPSNLHISVFSNQTDKADENWPQLLALHQLNLEREWMAIAKFYISYLIGNNLYRDDNATPVHGKATIVKNSASANKEFLESELTYKVKIILPLNDNYEGGGYHFIQQNCTVDDPPLGHALVHPGRLTHLAKELPVTRGTKYYLSYWHHTFFQFPIKVHGQPFIPGFTKEPSEDASEKDKLEFLELISSQ